MATYTEPAPHVHTLCMFVTVSFLPRLERALISSSSKESVCSVPLAGRCLVSLSLFLSSRADFNADEGRRCANVKTGAGGGECGKGEREYLKSRLMIRDDMRHSSLSDVWLDCRYCSLSFIFRELATDAGVHASECA